MSEAQETYDAQVDALHRAIEQEVEFRMTVRWDDGGQRFVLGTVDYDLELTPEAVHMIEGQIKNVIRAMSREVRAKGIQVID